MQSTKTQSFYAGASLREISAASWIVENRTGKYVALLFKTQAGYLIIEAASDADHDDDANHDAASLAFADASAVSAYFGGGRDVFKSAVKGSAVKERGSINGWPASVDDPVPDAEAMERTGLPAFKKALGQKTTYVAGYHLHLASGGAWKKSFCPQLATLESAPQRAGPFATETEQLAELGFRRKQTSAQ